MTHKLTFIEYLVTLALVVGVATYSYTKLSAYLITLVEQSFNTLP